MEEIEREKQHRVWFCVIQYIVTDINVCCRSVLLKEIESEKRHRVWFCVIQYIVTDINVYCRSVDGGDRT